MISGKLFKNITIFSIVMLIIATAFVGIGCVDNQETTEETTSEDATTEEVEAESIMIKGSDTVLPLTQAEAEEFMIANPEKSITVIGGGSGVGIAALIDGEVEIAMASRKIKDSEIENAQANGINPVEHIIAWDGIAVVVNPENPVTELTFEQLKSIYDGSVSNWADVGGEDLAITVITRDSSSGTYGYFQEEVLLDEEYRQDALVQPATGAIVQEVGQNTGAIGYIGYAYLDETTTALALDGGDGFVEPTPENIMAGDYPLARPLHYYTDGEPTGLAEEYIDYVMSSTGQDIVSEVGYFPVN
ncbi:PstS family phosphate ABC transporter substrate-binding protein [Methanolobus bombayensis]|uniref:PstS family phosphate ABC transporter substrate-binding protein n=1 Tax=Methanolobus bombayensis TaxID=38023 RepID=UPI001AEB63D9|nr:PstS family phosphate ABC transporter substrate-binding protein [Methanolobus bombayensis]MBP1910044.1 phosphate transport system substrate-binding protein [Methanolobus bombayensis]